MAQLINDAVLQAVLAEYGWAAFSCEPLSGGLINSTFLIRDQNKLPIAVLQRLHHIFDATVNTDISHVTQHLKARGLTTPELLDTTSGELCISNTSGVWRALSFIDGESFNKIPSTDYAHSAGHWVGVFHKALSKYDKEFVFKRSGVHDTEAHLARLATKQSSEDWSNDAEALRERILETSQRLPQLSKELPKRVCHGDLKISNILFRHGEPKALCLVDLDTMGHQTLAYELGDALRSWCNLNKENDASPTPDLNIAEAALSGYAQVMGNLISNEEVDSIALGYETICVELAARFCVDIYDDNYFGWDATHYADRRAHNFARANGQHKMAKSLATSRNRLIELCRRSFKR